MTGQLSYSKLDNALADVADQFLVRLGEVGARGADALLAEFPEHAEQLRRLLPAMLTLTAFGESRVESDDARVAQPLGDFRLLREIGRGGMGVVYEAEQLSLPRKVAVKILPLAAMLDERPLQRFKHEAAAAAMLKHPHIVSIYSVGCDRGVYYYAMELIEGRDLRQIIDDRIAARSPAGYGEQDNTGGASVNIQSSETARALFDTTRPNSDFFRWVARLGIQAAEALEEAHQHGIVHRDIKPSNLMVDGRGHLWVTDFGLAQIESGPTLSMTGDFLGTLRYMSPEQASGRPAMVDCRTDIYSLGATLYELATDRPVVAGNDRAEILREIAEVDPALPRKYAPAMPTDLETILLTSLNKEPSARYDSAMALADDLRRFLEHRPVVACRATRWNHSIKWVRRHRAVSALLAVSTCAVLLLLAGALWHNHRLREEIAKSDARNLQLREVTYLQDIPRIEKAWRDGALDRASHLLAYHIPRPDEPDVRDFAWHWLNRVLHDEELVLRGHTDEVSAVTYNSTGSLIASGGHDSSVRIWSALTGDQLRVLEGHQGNVNCLAFINSDMELLSGGDDGLIHHWRLDDGRILHTFQGHVGNVLSLSVNRDEDLLATGGEDHVLRIWSLKDGTLLRSVVGAGDWIRAVLFSPDGKYLATASRDGLVRVYGHPDWELVWEHARSNQRPLSLDFDRTGETLLVGEELGSVNLFKTETGERLANCLNAGGKKRAVSLRDGGGRFVAVDFEGRVYQDQVDTVSRTPFRHTHALQRVWAAARSPDDRFIATAGADGTVRIWSLDRPLGGETLFSASARSMHHSAIPQDFRTAAGGG